MISCAKHQFAIKSLRKSVLQIISARKPSTHNIHAFSDSATILNHTFATQALSRFWPVPLWRTIPTTAAAATTTAQVPRNAGRGHHPHLVGPGGGRSGICFSPPGASPTEGPETHHKIQGASPTAGGGVDHVGSLVFKDLTVRGFFPQILVVLYMHVPHHRFPKLMCPKRAFLILNVRGL